MKNKKTIILGLLSVLALTSCGNTGDNTNQNWWNPTTWDWSWTNPTNWFKDGDEQPSEQVTEEPEVIPDANLGMFRFNAYGINGKKTLSVNVNPVDAYVDLTWTSNKTEVVVTKTGDKTADVYVTDYFADYGTISVTDAVSGITATGKVYSYAKTTFASSMTSLAHGTNATIVVSDTENHATTSGVQKVSQSKTFLENGSTQIYGEWEPADIGWNRQMSVVYMHIAYEGSYSPVVYNVTNDTQYHKITDVATNSGIKRVTIAVTLNPGTNLILIQPRTTASLPVKGEPEMIEHIGAFTIANIQSVTSMSIGDTTFNN